MRCVPFFFSFFFSLVVARCIVPACRVPIFVRCIPPSRELGLALRCRLAAHRLLSDSTRRMGTVVTNDCSARPRPGVDRICIQSFGSLCNIVGTQGHGPQTEGALAPIYWRRGMELRE